MKRSWKKTAAAVAGVVAALSGTSRAALNFNVEPNGWPDEPRRTAAVNALQAVVNRYNAYGDFGGYNIYAYYNAGIPTAQSNYQGSIGYGGTYPNERVTLHESNHYLGSGTYGHTYDGPRAIAILEQFDGVGARFGTDGTHFWGYGMNYDNEWSEIAAQRNIPIMYALRGDWGIGSTANPTAWASTSVNLTASDAAGESGFNYASKWNDNTFAHPNADYSTGAFSVRTPTGYPSWTFAGKSLTVNAGGSLLFNGWGRTGVVTIKNLTVNGGTIRHDQQSIDVMQLAGNVALASTSTFDAANGNIKVLAPVSGAGSLVKNGKFTVTLAGNGSYAGDTTINAGTLQLAPVTPVASYSFDNVSGSTVVNGGSGGTGMNGTLANGAAIVGGGQSGNAVSLAGGASVDINSPITDLHNQGNWSLSAWVKTSTAGSTVLTKGSGTSWSNGNTIFYLGDGTAGGSGGIPSGVRYGGGFFQGSTSATSVTNNAWHQITYVNSGGTYAIYTDGNSQPLSTGNSGFGNSDIGSVVRLGATTNTVAGDGTVNFNGLMDNVQFYNQALSGSQISALFQSKNPTGTLPTATNVTIAAGAALDVNGATQTIGSLNGPVGSAVRLGAGQLTVSPASSSTFAGTISGAGGSLVKGGSSTLTLSGVNNYTGATVINGGTLRLSNPAGVAAATPIARYNFANLIGSTVVNEGSGGSTMNGLLNANGGTGSINTTAGPAAGMGALVLNGTGTTVDVNSGVTSLSNASNWTVSAWVKTTQAGATILNKGDGTNWNSGFSTFYLGDGDDTGSGGLPDAVRWGGGWLAGATPVNDGKWHLLTYTDSAGATAVYVDGALETLSQSQFLNTDTGTKIRIGFAADPGDGPAVTNGSLSGINIYNTSLSPAQVAAMYNSVVGAATPLPAGTNLSIASGATLDVNGVVQQIASLSGPAGSAVTLGAGQLIVNSSTNTTFAGAISGTGGSLVKSGTATLTLTGSHAYTGATTATGGKLVLTKSLTSSSAVNAIGGSIQLASDGSKNLVIKTSSVAVGGGSKIDLSDNKMIVSGAAAGSTFSNGSYQGVAGLVVSGRAGGSWTGQGIVTTQADAVGNNPLTSLAVASADELGRVGSSFAGQNLVTGDEMVMYTWAGDANLDGVINGDDYFRIDSSFNTPSLLGWANGDFNYDGQKNGDDYFIIDANMNRATTVMGGGGGGGSGGVVAVPEPAGVGAVMLAWAGFGLGRRRKIAR